ncbi:MAG TPA: ABC transporter permease [Holophagaceae bacterium]|nr:ABC transporter permease [Holophagaceae bacterium]
MNSRELLRAALRALRAHKLRSFLTLLGVIIGVATIVGVVGVINGLNVYVKEKIIVLAPDVYIVDRFGFIRSREEFIQALKRPPLRWNEFERLKGGVLTHADIVGARALQSMAVNNGEKRVPGAFVVGATSNFAELLKLSFEDGRFYTDGEDQGAANVAIIGSDIKDELFGHLNPLGRTFLVHGLPFRVIGTLPKEGRGIGFNKDQLVIVPMQVYRKNFMNPNDPFSFLIRAKGGVEGLNESIDETRTLLRAIRHTPYKDADPFGILTQDQLQELWRAISSATFILLLLISSVSLGVGGIVIMNIMLVSVVERTQEIGIRMAIGARKRDIRTQFLLEAALLSLMGGVVGVLVGSGGALAVRAVTGFPAQITPMIILSGVFLATLVGLAAGFLPALRASNLVVIDAIRAE